MFEVLRSRQVRAEFLVTGWGGFFAFNGPKQSPQIAWRPPWLPAPAKESSGFPVQGHKHEERFRGPFLPAGPGHRPQVNGRETSRLSLPARKPCAPPGQLAKKPEINGLSFFCELAPIERQRKPALTPWWRSAGPSNIFPQPPRIGFPVLLRS